MSDAIWYGRLLIWIGALVMLIEAVAGRSNTLTTVLAVTMVTVGLASMIYGLATEGFAARGAKTDSTREAVADAAED